MGIVGKSGSSDSNHKLVILGHTKAFFHLFSWGENTTPVPSAGF